MNKPEENLSQSIYVEHRNVTKGYVRGFVDDKKKKVGF
jgi:hypothetical protein